MSDSIKKPYFIEHYENGSRKRETYMENGIFHRIGGPAIIEYYGNGNVKSKSYMKHGNLHRLDGPACKDYDETGKMTCKDYWENGHKNKVVYYDPDNNIKELEIINRYDNGSLKSIMYYENGLLHRIDGRAVIEYDEYERLQCEKYYKNGKLHCLFGPAVIQYDNNMNKRSGMSSGSNGSIKCEEYYENGKLHRTDGPAIIYYFENNIKNDEYYQNGKKHRETYYENDKLHRDNGPAYISYYETGHKESDTYYKNGLLHRIGEPCDIEYDKDGHVTRKLYYENGIKYKEEYFDNDKLHRVDGPAIIYYKNYEKLGEEYWQNGVQINTKGDVKQLVITNLTNQIFMDFNNLNVINITKTDILIHLIDTNDEKILLDIIKDAYHELIINKCLEKEKYELITKMYKINNNIIDEIIKSKNIKKFLEYLINN